MSTNSEKNTTNQSKSSGNTKTLDQKIREQKTKEEKESAARVAAENQTLLTVESKKSEIKGRIDNEKSPSSQKNKDERKTIGSEKDPTPVRVTQRYQKQKKENLKMFRNSQ